jgi:hypothetical protein
MIIKPPEEPKKPEPPVIDPVPPKVKEELPVIVADDSIFIFLDIDNDHNTGYDIFNRSITQTTAFGADVAINISGRFGVVRSSGYYEFTGGNIDDWRWERLGGIITGNDNKRLETQIELQRLGLEMSKGFGVWFYARNWNNENEDFATDEILMTDIESDNEQNAIPNQNGNSRADYVIIDIEGSEQITELSENYELDIIEYYESFILVNITVDQRSHMEQNGYKKKIKDIPNRTTINIQSHQFNTKLGEPEIPKNLKIEAYEQGVEGTYIIQFIGPIKDTWLNQISDLGIELSYYQPNYAYIVQMNSSLEDIIRDLDFVQWIGIYQPAYKIGPQLQQGDLKIILKNSSTIEKTIEILNSISTIQNIGYDSGFDHFYITLFANSSVIPTIANYPDVLWLEEYQVPTLDDETASEIVGGFWALDTPWDEPGSFANSLGWNGTTVTVSITDTGIGNGTIGNADHLDFENRVINGTQYGSLTSWVDGHGHGTHVAGIVAGDGYEGTGTTYPTSQTSKKYYVGLGVAPDAKLFAQRIFNSAGSWSGPSSWDPFFQTAFDNGVYIHQNSWSGSGDSAYNSDDVDYDQAVRDSATSTSGDQPMIICVSASNDGPGAGTIGSPGSGKNVITVGASENYFYDSLKYGHITGVSADNIDEIASFSSRGLEDDGRIKPDLVAPGAVVLSANSTSGSNVLHGIYSEDDRYLWCSGTSQSCPQISGSAACVVEWWQANNNGTKPSPAMVKAVLINTATDMGIPDIPNGNEGWGRVFLPDLFAPKATMEFHDQDTLLQTGNKSIYDCYIGSTDHPLKITLVWTDPAGTAFSIPSLVNNLDLKVTAPDNSSIYYGNVFSNGISTPGTSNANSNWDSDSDGFDDRNNVECVFIPKEDVSVGVYKVEIIADNVPTDAVSNSTNTDQDFALVINGDFSVQNDVGIEKLIVPKSQKKNENAKLTATIRNYGINNQTNQFNVRCIIKNPLGTEVLNNTKVINTLPSFDIINKTWVYIPTTEGQYTVTVRTELTNDDNDKNDASTKYMMVSHELNEIASFTGAYRYDRFGWNVSYAGDVNGDGVADVIIGAPYNDSEDGSLSDSGAAYIFYGPRKGNYSAESADIKIYGTATNDHFGWDVAGIGDVNGSFDDVIIGAPGNTSNTPGKAYIFHGWTITNDGDGVITANGADVIITGEANGDRFGGSVAGAGEVNNVAYNDIIIGAYLNDNNAYTDNGRAYVFFGDGNIPTSASAADDIINGTEDNEMLGFSVAGAGDMDGDNVDDMVIGAPGADNNRGKCYIYGGFVIIPGGNITYNFSSGAGINKWFYHKNTETSAPPGSGPDITSEVELTSYFAIAYSDNVSTPKSPDSVNSGTNNRYNLHHFKFNINEPETAINSLTVLWEGYDTRRTSMFYIYNFGSSGWTSVGTGTSTTTDNIISTTYTSNIGNYLNSAGRLDLVSTARDGNLVYYYLYTDYVKVNFSYDPYIDNSFKTIINGEHQGDYLGWSVNSSGDVNADGFDDIVFGAPGFDNSRGRAYVVWGNESLLSNIPAQKANITLNGGSIGDKFGYSVAGTDMGADGYSDILVGAPYNDTINGSKTDAGAVYVFNGSRAIPAILNAGNYTRNGEFANDHFGWSVSNAFDINIDNYNDILVGAPHYDNGSITDVGKAYVLSIIPEFPDLIVPIIIIILIMAVWKVAVFKKQKNRPINH